MQQSDMTSTNAPARAPIITACEGHLVQFYSTEKYIIKALAEFVHLGLLRGEGLLIAATAEHSRGMAMELKKTLPELQDYINRRQLVFANAHDCLDRVMYDDKPNREGFFNLFTPLVSEMKQVYPKVRVYGELVNLLCAEQRHDAALTLEAYWNELLAADPSVLLMCGYDHAHLDAHQGGGKLFRAVSDTHGDTIGDEAATKESHIPVLQQHSITHKLDQRNIERKLRLQSESCLASAQEITNPLAIVKLSVDQLTSLLESGDPKTLSPEMLSQKLKVIDNATTRITKSLRQLVATVKPGIKAGAADS